MSFDVWCRWLPVGLAALTLAACTTSVGMMGPPNTSPGAPSAAVLGGAVSDCERDDNPAKVIKGCSFLIAVGALDQAHLARAYYNRGQAFEDGKDLTRALADYDGAIAAYGAAIREAPNDEELHYRLGYAYRAKGELDRAIASFTTAIQLKPDFAAAYYGRGLAYRTKGDFPRAIDSFTRAIQLKPDYAAAYRMRSLTYRAAGDFPRAIADCNRVTQLDPKSGC